MVFNYGFWRKSGSMKSVCREVKLYFSSNWLVNVIAGIAVIIIVLFQATSEASVPKYLNADVVNYYFEILVNLSLGYLVSAIFYILVVYYPERKTRIAVSAKTSILFSRVLVRLRTAIDSVLLAVDVRFEACEELPSKLTDVLQKRDLIHSLKQKKLEDRHYGKRRALDDLVRVSNELESLIDKLVPYIGYMEINELELYSVLEDILIFEYIGQHDEFPPKSTLLADEFPTIVQAYYDCQKVRGVDITLISWRD
ncbi:hypothetical protein VCRA2113O325_110114 [Vibrio crassostreae]|nr:hypothetical protein VCRA2113O322_110049 [Vibrio crassostreae]CAK1716840.1 hypothetical protein VCRA2113O326_110061 [Vibrio crassostreae]CAK2535833.1 hypothetical protein VCRA2113O321_110061 [Vibrio crassostreae]CAK2538979.1 hypothetical protein VCRA2113O323_110114 [Vibrio crassostreae]CAK2592312.1 hypothetical protein VCRA2113O325_110114 [Vibrio crassostreae]